jgi:hypothetical protein
LLSQAQPLVLHPDITILFAAVGLMIGILPTGICGDTIHQVNALRSILRPQLFEVTCV